MEKATGGQQLVKARIKQNELTSGSVEVQPSEQSSDTLSCNLGNDNRACKKQRESSTEYQVVMK